MILSITSKGFIFYYCMVLSGIEYGQNPAFLLVALTRNTHRLFVSLPTVVHPQMYFLAFGNSRVLCSSVFGCYITACFCMLLFVLGYIRCTLQDKVTLRHLSKLLKFRFIFLLRLFFASALCFTPFLIFSSLRLLLFFFMKSFVWRASNIFSIAFFFFLLIHVYFVQCAVLQL